MQGRGDIQEQFIGVLDEPVRVVSSGLGPAEIQTLDYVLEPFRIPPAPTKHFIIFERLRDEFLMYGTTYAGFVDRMITRAFDELMPALDAHMQAFVARHLRPDDLMFFGTTVVLGNEVVWLAGERDSGKTTVALELMLRFGARPLSDDYAVWRDGRLTPFPKCLRLRPGSFHCFEGRLQGIRVKPHYRNNPVWLVNPCAELRRPASRGQSMGLIVNCSFNGDLLEPARLDTQRRNQGLARLQQTRLRPRRGGEEMVDAATTDFRFCSLAFRDGAEAAEQIARYASEGD